MGFSGFHPMLMVKTTYLSGLRFSLCCGKNFVKELICSISTTWRRDADTTRKAVDKLSNTYNPCVSGNAESIQLLVSLMDASGGGGIMWRRSCDLYFIVSYMRAGWIAGWIDLLLHIGVISWIHAVSKYYELMQDPEISERAKSLMPGHSCWMTFRV